jgi:hypothetical protein
MAVLVINKKHKPKWIKWGRNFDAFALQGLTMESHNSTATIFQHPVDYSKQGLSDEVLLNPATYSASMFIADTPQSYGEQFRNWGRFLNGEQGERLSESVYNILKKLRGVLVDVEETYTGTLKSMMVNEVSATRELEKGLRITLNMQEVFFAESTKTEEYIREAETPAEKVVEAKTKPLENKNNPPKKEVTEQQKRQSGLSKVTGKGSNAKGAKL